MFSISGNHSYMWPFGRLASHLGGRFLLEVQTRRGWSVWWYQFILWSYKDPSIMHSEYYPVSHARCSSAWASWTHHRPAALLFPRAQGLQHCLQSMVTTLSITLISNTHRSPSNIQQGIFGTLLLRISTILHTWPFFYHTVHRLSCSKTEIIVWSPKSIWIITGLIVRSDIKRVDPGVLDDHHTFPIQTASNSPHLLEVCQLGRCYSAGENVTTDRLSPASSHRGTMEIPRKRGYSLFYCYPCSWSQNPVLSEASMVS